MLGNGRCECYCFDGVTRLGHIRGKMRKKVWVSAGDIVLVGLREYQDDKARGGVRPGGRRRSEPTCFESHSSTRVARRPIARRVSRAIPRLASSR